MFVRWCESDVQNGWSSLFVYTAVFAITLALLGRGGNSGNHISYDEFVKEFLLKGRVKEIILTEKGRIYVEILDGLIVIL